MFYKDSQNIYRVRPLEAFDWLVHGFGTRWSNAFGTCRNLATLHQIHSSTVVDAEGRAGCLGEGDALVANTPGVLVAVKTADCIPMLMVDSRQHAVAAVHAGWRGTARNIAAAAIAKMKEKFSSRVEDLHVAIGPGIGKCCYEVGPEVAAQFRAYDPTLRNLTHTAHLDLVAINGRQIGDCGVPPAQIYTAGICTLCNSEFHSYRRDKQQAGRMLSVAGIR
jgi:YfiH family protein